MFQFNPVVKQLSQAATQFATQITQFNHITQTSQNNKTLTQ